MTGIKDFFVKIGMLKKVGPKEAKPTPAVPKVPAKPGAKKPFNFNLYMKAVNLFFKDFFGKKVPYFFKNIGPSFKKFPEWWKKLPQDEQISYGVLLLGDLMLIIGVVLLIVI